MSKYPYKTVNIDTTRTLRNTLNSNFKDIESDFKEVKKDFDNAVEIVSDRAFNKVVDAAKIEWLPPVNTYSDLSKTYPNASEGKTVMTRDSGKVYRYNGTSWVEIQDIDPTVINEVDRRLTAQLAETTNKVDDIGVNVKALGLGNNQDQDDATLLQSIFDNAKELDEILVPYGTTLYFKSGIIVKKALRFRCYGEIKIIVQNIVAFDFVGKETTITGSNFTENQDWYIRKITGISGDRTSTAFRMQHNMFSRFRIDHAYDLKHVVHFKGVTGSERNSRMGENIWEMVLWRLCDKAIYFEGVTDWENAPFAEGNQFINGFISGSNHGMYIDNYIKAGGMLITCGIDNLEVVGGKDFINKVDTTKYTIGNLILTRFIRYPKCEFARNDMVLSPNFGSLMVGNLQINGDVEVYDLASDDKTKTDGISLLRTGAIKMTSANPFPYIDLRDNRADNYDTRIALADGKNLQVNAGGNGTTNNTLYVERDGLRINPNGIGKTIPANTPTANITLPITMNDNLYGIYVSPGWYTNWKITNRTVNGFSIEFETPPPTDSTFDYMIFVN